MKAAGDAGAVSEAVDTDHGPVALVRAVVATGIGKGVVDSDGDGYDPGAFGAAGQKVILSAWGHSAVAYGIPPVGAGVIREVGSDAVFVGELWLSMQAGRDAHDVLRRRGAGQEWSYALRATKVRRARPGEQPGTYIEALQTWEASPVWKGAGLGTHTIAVVGDDLDAAHRAELAQIAGRVMNQPKSDRAALEAIRLRMIERSHRARMGSRA
jgi:hypothetical protein